MMPALLTSTSMRPNFSAIGNSAFDLLRFSQVTRPGRDLRSKRKQVSDCPLKFFPVASQKREVRSVAGKFAGHCQTKTSGSTGDHYNFVSQRIASSKPEQQNSCQCASGADNVTRFYHYRLPASPLEATCLVRLSWVEVCDEAVELFIGVHEHFHEACGLSCFRSVTPSKTGR